MMDEILIAVATVALLALVLWLLWVTLRRRKPVTMTLPPLRHQADQPPLPYIVIEPFDRRRYNSETARAMREMRQREHAENEFSRTQLHALAAKAEADRLRRQSDAKVRASMAGPAVSPPADYTSAALLALAMANLNHPAAAAPAAAAAISPAGGDFGGGGATGAWSAPEPAAPSCSPPSDSGGGFSGGDSGGGGGAD